MASHTVPFASRIVASSAREMLARDRARAQKIMSGMHPHGPVAIRELRERRRHHHEHRHHHPAGDDQSSGGTGTGSAPSGTGSEPTSGGTGVDVTDAGVTYTATVGVGSPATKYTLLIDTGERQRACMRFRDDHDADETRARAYRQLEHLGRRWQAVRKDHRREVDGGQSGASRPR